MELFARAVEATWVVTLHGELDLATVPAFRSATRQAIQDGWTDFVIDLEPVSFVDSAGLGVLIGLRRRIGEVDGTLRLRVNQRVSTLIDNADLDGLFELDVSVDT